jgi:hypothetical protein
MFNLARGMRRNPRDVRCEGILNYIVSVQLLELCDKDISALTNASQSQYHSNNFF